MLIQIESIYSWFHISVRSAPKNWQSITKFKSPPKSRYTHQNTIERKPSWPSGHTYKCHPELMTRHAGKSFTSGLRVILCWRLANISRSRSGRLPRFVASSANMAMSSSLGIFKADTPFRCRRRGLLSGVLEHHPNWYIDEVQSALSEKNSKWYGDNNHASTRTAAQQRREAEPLGEASVPKNVRRAFPHLNRASGLWHEKNPCLCWFLQLKHLQQTAQESVRKWSCRTGFRCV